MANVDSQRLPMSRLGGTARCKYFVYKPPSPFDIEAVLALAPQLNMHALPKYAFGGDTPCLDAIPPLCPVVAACCKTLPRWFLRHILDFLDPRRARVDCPKCYSDTIWGSAETIWLEPIWLPPDSMWVPSPARVNVDQICIGPGQIWIRPDARGTLIRTGQLSTWIAR